MNRATLVALTLGLAALGLADAIYLADTALTGGTLACSIQGLDGCNVVAKSVYSYLFGIPLAVYGVAFYGAFVILAFVGHVKKKRIIAQLLAAFGVIGALASIVFMYIQLELIRAVCVYCLGSAVISGLLFITTLMLLVATKKQPVPTIVPDIEGIEA